MATFRVGTYVFWIVVLEVRFSYKSEEHYLSLILLAAHSGTDPAGQHGSWLTGVLWDNH